MTDEAQGSKNELGQSVPLSDGLGGYNLPWLDNTEFVLNLTSNIKINITRMPINELGYCASLFINKCIVNLNTPDFAAKEIIEFAKQEFSQALDELRKYENPEQIQVTHKK